MTDGYNPNYVIQELRKRGAMHYVCPICKGSNFGVQGEVATISTTNRITTMNLGMYIPCAMMTCMNCGNVQFFALGILDSHMIDEAKKNKDNE